ncbi:MAG: LysR family transcriptional regulator, partial [Mobilicoccus sp.]|nr:LysR family transcriptional regulator [Mobilicoccus sp.]
MLDLRGVVALRELRDRGSIAGAALALGYTASAVSQQLATLEREVGVPLIDRGPKSAALNAAGREFLAAAGDLPDRLEKARTRAAAATGRLSGRVVVAAIPSVAAAVAGAVAGLRRDEPLLDMVLVQSSAPQAQRALVEGRTDIAIIDDWGTRSTALDSRLMVRQCFDEPVVLASPAEGATRRPAPSDRHSSRIGTDVVALARALVTDLPFLSATEGTYSREMADAWLAHHGVTPRVRWE